MSDCHRYQVLNTPAQAISVGNSASLTISKVTVDNSAGDTDSLGHNTDVRSVYYNHHFVLLTARTFRDSTSPHLTSRLRTVVGVHNSFKH